MTGKAWVPTEAEVATVETEKAKVDAGRNGKPKSADGPKLDAATVLLLRASHPGKLLIAVEDDFCKAYAGDHKILKAKQFGFVTEERAGGARVAVFPEDKLQDVLDELTKDEDLHVV